MTIRDCIAQMAKYSADAVYLNSGVKFVIYEMGSRCEKNGYNFSKIKYNKDGSFKCFRKILITLYDAGKSTSFEGIKGFDIIKKYSLYDKKKKPEENYFLDNQFLVPERELNLFISYNRGINEYQTIQAPGYMYTDMMLMMDMFEDSMAD